MFDRVLIISLFQGNNKDTDISEVYYTTQEMKFLMKDFFSKCEGTIAWCRFVHIYWRNPLQKTFWLYKHQFIAF